MQAGAVFKIYLKNVFSFGKMMVEFAIKIKLI